MNCEGKQAFDTMTLANQVSKRRNRAGHKGNPYRCGCGKFHIGSVFSTRRSGERHSARKRREMTA